MHWLVLGCGYTGTRLARALIAQAERVTITRRDPEAARALGAELGCEAIAATLGQPIDVPEVVVCLAPPGDDPAGEVRTLMAARRLVYVSSTGVYAPAHGDRVDESWSTEPVTAAGKARLAAERAVAEHGNAIALRVAGIHGPGRGLVDRIRAGTYRVVGDGSSHVSRIHVDDLVAAILAAGASRVTGAVNIADDDPAPIGEVADAIAAREGVPPPPRVPVTAVPPEVAGMLTADRRIANARMKRELGVVLRYASWRDA